MEEKKYKGSISKVPGLSLDAKVRNCHDRYLPAFSYYDHQKISIDNRPSIDNSNFEHWPNGESGRCLSIEKYEGRFKKRENVLTQKDPDRTRAKKTRQLLAKKKRNSFNKRIKCKYQKQMVKFKQEMPTQNVPKWKKNKKHKIHHSNKPRRNPDGIIEPDMKIIIQERIKVIEVNIALENTADQIVKNEYVELSELSKVLGEYKGRGKVSKDKDRSFEKVGETGICGVDSILNLLRNSELKSFPHHELCHHRLKCSLCIVRSALQKIELNKAS